MLRENLTQSGALSRACKRVVKPLLAAGLAASLSSAFLATDAQAKITLTRLGSYEAGVFDESAAEINAYDPINQLVFVINANDESADVIDVSDPSNPNKVGSIDFSSLDATNPNSVAYKNGILAVALAGEETTDTGIVAFYDASADFSGAVAPLGTADAGYLPDMVTFTPDGLTVLVANEGEASTELTDEVPDFNPPGTVSVISISGGVEAFSVDSEVEATFDVFAPGGSLALGATLDEIKEPFGPDAPKVRIHPNADSLENDIEPEYIAVSPDGTTAYVGLQENNAIAVLDIATAEFTAIFPLGMKDHSLFFNALDAEKNDDEAVIETQPFYGLYMPDAMTTYEVDGTVYIVTANEGDTRDPGDFGDFEDGGLGDEMDLSDAVLNEDIFPNFDELTDSSGLGDAKTFSFGGDLDNDGTVDQILLAGARSFSIWSTDGRLVFDSGADFERITAGFFPDNFNASNDDNSIDDRSDNKGPEPEAVAIGEIDGRFYAFIGLERISGVMVYDVTDPFAPVFIDYVNARDFSLDPENQVDVGPECVNFVPATDSPNGENLLIVSSEVSGSTAVYQIDVVETTTIQILHASDLEGGVDALENAPNFAAIIEGLEINALMRGVPTVILSAGDNYIPGPFFSASGDGDIEEALAASVQDLFQDSSLTDISAASGRVDISIMNIIGFDASAIGNHEFDAGVSAIEDIILTDIDFGEEPVEVSWLGAQFPYLSSNLDFSESGLADAYTSEILDNSAFRSLPFDLEAATEAPKIAPATLVNIGGKFVGVVGATTQLIEQISSPGDVMETTGGANDMEALAAVLQPVIDELAEETDIIILVSHLQQIALEEELAGLLSGVDVIIAGGSDTLLANEDDVLRSGDTAEDSYPVQTVDADGNPLAIVSTDGEYSYVGRLELTFDAEGIIQTDSFEDLNNGPYATTDAVVEALWGDYDSAFVAGSKGGRVAYLIEEGLYPIISAKDGNIVGFTDVYIEGRRERVRTEETTLGDLSADANLWQAKKYDKTVSVSIKNGGGIRASIGEISGDRGLLLPPQANPLSGKETGEISQLDLENSLRFNNALSILTVDAQELYWIMEYAVSATAEGSTPGQFPQIGGMAFAFDPAGDAIEIDEESGEITTPGTRITDLVIMDANGQPSMQIVQDGVFVADADTEIRLVTLSFLAGGGDGYPFALFGDDQVDLADVLTEEGEFTFADPGTEQDAIAEYLYEFFSSAAFNMLDSTKAGDLRIQNLDSRSSSLQPGVDLETGTIVATANGGTFEIDVDTLEFASWEAAEDLDWLWFSFIDESSATSEELSGSGTLAVVIDANDSVHSRSGFIEVAGKVITVIQSGTDASEESFELFPAENNISGLGGQLIVRLAATDGADWTANARVNWISIITGDSGEGDGYVILSVGRNTGTARNGTVIIAGETFTVHQGAAEANLPDPDRLPAGEVTENEDGSFEIEWFGHFFLMGDSGWAIHDDWGFTWFPTSQPDSGALWFYAEDLGWLYTNDDVDPFVYSHELSDWLYLLRLDGEAYIYSNADQSWTQL